MNHLISFLDQDMIQALGWTFIHTLWQGCVIVLVMIYALQRIPQKDAVKRYTVATASMMSMLVAAVATFALLYFQPGQAEGGGSSDLQPVMVAGESAGWTLTGWLHQNLDALVAIWAIGVAVLSLRLIVGMAFIYRLKQSSSDLTYTLGHKAKHIADSLNYKRALVIAESALVKIPVVVGYLKPMVLFPVGAVNQLTAEEVEAVLAHEIAHLVRNDFIHNLIQSVIEVIFYYHPAVWWMSAVVRAERENCCDDLAIQVCGNSFTYARALVRLQEVGSSSPALALPFSGSKHHLLERVKRILNQPQNKSNLMEKITATSLLLICLIFASFSDGSAESEERAYVEIPRLVSEYHAYLDYTARTDTIIPRVSRTIIREEEDGKSIELEMENGEVKRLVVDGEEIPADRYAEFKDQIGNLRQGVLEVPPPPSVPAPPAPVMPDMPPMPPAPGTAPRPPAPPVPPAPPSAVPAPDAPHLGNYEYDFEFDAMDFNMDSIDFNFDRDMVIEVAPQIHKGHVEKRRNKSIIIRERDENGSLHYRVEGSNSNIVIDAAEGVAIIDGQEIQIDSDSIIVIEETETHAPPAYRFEVAPDVQWQTEWAKQWEENWDSAKWAKHWEDTWDPDEWAAYWEQNKEEWAQHQKELEEKMARYEESMRKYKESPEWQKYMKEIEKYHEQLQSQEVEEIIFIESDGDKEEFIIRSKEEAQEAMEDAERIRREVEVRVREAKEKQEKEDKESGGENGHSSVDQDVQYKYVIAKKDSFTWTAEDMVNIHHLNDVHGLEYITITADAGDVDSETGEVKFSGGAIELEVPEEGRSGTGSPERVVLVTAQPLTVDGELADHEYMKDHVIEVRVEGKHPPVDNSSTKARKAKY